MNVCVFCAANDLEDKYIAPAKEFARLLAEGGHTLIWGGSDRGLMKVMADGVSQGGGKIIGISMEELKHNLRKNADEMIIAKDLTERKATFLKRADILVMMVGGIGTLDETTEILEHKKHKRHEKPIIILNSAGFYDGLRQQLEQMENEGFLTDPLRELIRFAETPRQALTIIDEYARKAGPSGF